MRASPDALRQCTRRRPLSMDFMPVSWHYISGQFSLQAPRKPQKSAISLPQAPSKLSNFSRTSDGFRLTAAGAEVLAHVQRIEKSLAECAEALEMLSGGRGRVS